MTAQLSSPEKQSIDNTCSKFQFLNIKFLILRLISFPCSLYRSLNMGSIDMWLDLTLSSEQPLEAAAAKLPFYDLKSHEPEYSPTSPSPLLDFHHQKRENCAIGTSSSVIIKAFATFVCAVTDLPRVSFVAVTQQHRYLVVASVHSLEYTRTMRSGDTTVSLYNAEATDLWKAKQSDFELYITTGPHTAANDHYPHRVSVGGMQ